MDKKFAKEEKKKGETFVKTIRIYRQDIRMEFGNWKNVPWIWFGFVFMEYQPL